jgi:hypothetical protein
METVFGMQNVQKIQSEYNISRLTAYSGEIQILTFRKLDEARLSTILSFGKLSIFWSTVHYSFWKEVQGIILTVEVRSVKGCL